MPRRLIFWKHVATATSAASASAAQTVGDYTQAAAVAVRVAASAAQTIGDYAQSASVAVIPDVVAVTAAQTVGDYTQAAQALNNPQTPQPNADLVAGAWVTAPLYAKVDEDPASDADYIWTPSASIARLALGAMTDPGTNLLHTLRLRARAHKGGGLTVRLRQGTGLGGDPTIQTWTPSVGASFALVQLSVDEANAANITDYGALYVELESTP